MECQKFDFFPFGEFVCDRLESDMVYNVLVAICWKFQVSDYDPFVVITKAQRDFSHIRAEI